MAISSNVQTYLTTWSAAFEQFYRPGIGDYLKRFGKTTRAITKNPKRKVLGTSMEVTMKTRKNRSARLTTDLMAPAPAPGPGQYATYNVRFNHTDASTNDFSALQIGFRTSWYDIKKKTDATFKDSAGDYIKQDIEDGLEDVAEEFAGSFHRDNNGKLGTVSAIKDDNSDLFDSAQAYQAASTECILKLSNTAIAHIGDGELIDLRNTTDGADEALAIRVVNVNPVDYTITVDIETGSTVGGNNFNVLNASIAAGDVVDVYLSGSRGIAVKGTLDNFFDSSQAYFSLSSSDRLGSTYRAMLPVRIDASAGGSAVQLTEDHFRKAGEAVGWANGSYLDADKRMMVMNRDQYRAVNLLQKDSGMTMLPALQSDIGSSMNKAFGFDGWTLHDPTLGTVALTVDDLAAYGVIDFLDMSTWEMVEPFPGGASFDFLPGEMAGMWSRTSYNHTNTAYGADNNGRPSKEFEAQGEQLYAFINVGPKRNVRVMGLDSTL